MFDRTHLDNNRLYFSGFWHLAYYFKSNKTAGSLSDNILQFKNGNQDYTKAWSAWAKDELSDVGIHFDYIVRALGHDELKVTRSSSLDVMGKYLAENLKAIYCPNTLEKVIANAKMWTLDRKKRSIAIIGSYKVAVHSNDFNNKNILIIDDITTTGTTIHEIAVTLYGVWPNARYYAFCLGKTSDLLDVNDSISNKYFTNLPR